MSKKNEVQILYSKREVCIFIIWLGFFSLMIVWLYLLNKKSIVKNYEKKLKNLEEIDLNFYINFVSCRFTEFFFVGELCLVKFLPENEILGWSVHFRPKKIEFVPNCKKHRLVEGAVSRRKSQETYCMYCFLRKMILLIRHG